MRSIMRLVMRCLILAALMLTGCVARQHSVVVSLRTLTIDVSVRYDTTIAQPCSSECFAADRQ